MAGFQRLEPADAFSDPRGASALLTDILEFRARVLIIQAARTGRKAVSTVDDHAAGQSRAPPAARRSIGLKRAGADLPRLTSEFPRTASPVPKIHLVRRLLIGLAQELS